MEGYNPQLVFSEGVYNASKYSGIQSFDNLRLGGNGISSSMNTAIVNCMPDMNKRFPILKELQGNGKKRAIKSVDGTFYSYLFGKQKKTSIIAKNIYPDGEKVGINNTTFYLFFKDRWFMKNQELIVDGFNGVRIHTQTDGVPEGAFFKYEAKLMGSGSSYVPARYLKAGTKWAGGIVSVSLEHSRGTEHRSYSGLRTQGQIALVRQSFRLAGNIENKKIMDITIPTPSGGQFKSYIDMERYGVESDFNAKKELKILTSKWNKDKNGIIQNIDANSGKPVPSFNGLMESVPSFNTLNYTVLTENKFSNWITDILSISGNLDLVNKSKNPVIDIVGGYGLMEEFDKAMKRTRVITNITTPDLFARKDGNGLNYGGYFTSYTHFSGATFRFKQHSMFDSGSEISETSPQHPINSSLKLSSFDGLILNFADVAVSSDYSTSNMANNITYLYEEGREYIDGTVRGMAQINGMQGKDISTDIDASSFEMMASLGIEVLYPQSLGRIRCIAS